MAVINGTDGDDTLIGTATEDVVGGLSGNDILNGGRGADRPVFDGSGRDVIHDFADGQDRIDVSGFGYRSLADLYAGGEFHGSADTLLTFSNAGESVRLQNLAPDRLTAADFIFA